MKKVSGFQPEPRKVQPEGLKEKSFPTIDEDPLTLQHADVFNGLTTLSIGLTLPRILTADDGVKTPCAPDVLTTLFDARLLDALVRLLATFGRLVDVEVFSIKNFNLLIINSFCSKPVDKIDSKRKIIYPVYQFFAVTGASDHRKRCADLRGHLPFFGWCPFYLSPRQFPHRPSTTPDPGGIRTPNQTAARHPLGLLWVGRFGSIFFTPLSSGIGGVGKSKGKGKLNTFKNIITYVNLPLRLLAMGWAKAGKSVKKILADFLVGGGFLPLQKLVHPGGCVFLQWQNEADCPKNVTKFLAFCSFCTQKGEVLFFGVCF